MRNYNVIENNLRIKFNYVVSNLKKHIKNQEK